ncbi:ethanolamine utilization protein EutH [Bacillus shivajii]|uniref:ethanolamine utilization protein EutH n=1 Tax=Bacillus shivajii TaxID=1983719 RepID=UPI001CFBB12C|nr:ethanolamine utilization protein EutH [Bacillus shivajii]UCZ54170.1 ethanolamine utilization protein EutH [Bacillus shivajii]
MWINDVIIWVLVIFMCVGALDRIFGNSFGLGKSFEEGFYAMGPLALAMLGIISLSPVIANILAPIISPLFQLIGADPAIFAGIVLAVDMGGYFLAEELAENRQAAIFSGIYLATMIGPTFVFTIPVALSLIERKDYPIFFKGVLLGIIPIPVGALLAGVLSGFSLRFIFIQLIPLLIFSLVICIGLIIAPRLMTKVFGVIGKAIVVIITLGLVFSIVETLTGFIIIPGMIPLSEGFGIVGIIAITLAGAFPLVQFIKIILKNGLTPLARKLETNESTLIGFVSSLAHSIPMFKLLKEMDERGKLMNVAFAVSGAFVIGGHLGFTASVEPNYIFPMMVGKLVSGLLGIMLAIYFVNRSSYEKENR